MSDNMDLNWDWEADIAWDNCAGSLGTLDGSKSCNFLVRYEPDPSPVPAAPSEEGTARSSCAFERFPHGRLELADNDNALPFPLLSQLESLPATYTSIDHVRYDNQIGSFGPGIADLIHPQAMSQEQNPAAAGSQM